jgi:hypothetical protein
MFRIARVRIRWIRGNQHESMEVLKLQPAQESHGTPLPLLLILLHPQNLRVRLRWVGFAARHRLDVWAWGLVILIAGIFILTRLPSTNVADSVIRSELATLETEDVTLNAETITMTYSSLDMGQAEDVFDRDKKTLIRGSQANPFVLDFVFPVPKPITGLAMDFGGMDFDLRVQVYGDGDSEPVLYESEYRNQPPEPHVELEFTSGPALVSRIYIEIEQFNPPDEPHIHVREVLFKE